MSTAALSAVEPMTAAEIDAQASDFLREIAECDREVTRYEQARTAEKARIDMRYDTLIDTQQRRRAELERAVWALAERADFGKKKSRDVGYGTYGRRTVPDRVQVTEPVTVLRWAEDSQRSLLRVTEKRDVPHSAVLDHFRRTGELPPGCVFIPAHDEPFAKADKETAQ